MKLIALTGLHGAGKDTVSDALPARKLAFADVLYREVAEAFGVTVEWLSDRRFKEVIQWEMRLDAGKNEEFLGYLRWSGKVWMGSEDDGQHPRSPRQILQWWGDYRRAQDPEYFVAQMIFAIKSEESNAVVTDVRFDNEAKIIRALGGQIWQVVRPGHEPPRTGHASETTGDEFAPDRVLVNDGSLEQLAEKARAAWAS